MKKEITIDHRGLKLKGDLTDEPNAKSWIIFAHGSGSSRKSSRNSWVASELNRQGHSTLLFDLLTPEEDLDYENRFNLPLLAERLLLATDWLLMSPVYQGQSLAYFGASTGAGAALIAASKIPPETPLLTVISRGGRPDLAGESSLREVSVPVLLIVGSMDGEVIDLNKMAQAHLPSAELEIVKGATHLFEEPGKLNQVVQLSADWLERQLKIRSDQRRPGNFYEGESHVVR
jgi:putative phosphoribosyl transferase